MTLRRGTLARKVKTVGSASAREWSEIQAAEALLLEKLKSTRRAYSVDELSRAIGRKLSQEMLREAVWDLIDRNKVRLTWNGKIQSV